MHYRYPLVDANYDLAFGDMHTHTHTHTHTNKQIQPTVHVQASDKDDCEHLHLSLAQGSKAQQSTLPVLMLAILMPIYYILHVHVSDLHTRYPSAGLSTCKIPEGRTCRLQSPQHVSTELHVAAD